MCCQVGLWEDCTVLIRRLRVRPVAIGAAVAGTVTTALVVLAAVAFACTSIMAPLTISPTGGAYGKATVVNTQVTANPGVKAGPAKYALHVTKGLTTLGADCMAFKGVLTLATITPDSHGDWNVNVTVPGTLKKGPHGICGIEVSPVKGQTGTEHDTFTVT